MFIQNSKKGQRKLYDETVIEQYKRSEKANSSKGLKRLTTIELLQDNLKEKQQEIDYLKQQLKEKDARIREKDQTISEFGLKFAKLADQAQQLNLADKPNLIEAKKGTVLDKKTPKETEEKRGFWNHFFGK